MHTVRLQRSQIHTGPLILVNQNHPLHAQNAPLACVDERWPEVLLERCSARLLAACVQAVQGSGVIVPVSGWRSRQEQQQIWSDTLERQGEVFTRRYVALPGCSEHETGLAIDLGKMADQIDFIRPDFPDTGVCGAFRRTAALYGFVQRYRREKETVTGIAEEPWHFRYVGVPHALWMEELGLALEEYADFVRDHPRTRCLPNGTPVRVSYWPCPFDAVEIPVPDTCWQISGDNVGGFFLTAWGGRGMKAARGLAMLDWGRLMAAVLVLCIHTSPLTSFSNAADLWLTRVLARVAVPYFLMLSGYFLARQNWQTIGHFCKKIFFMYVVAVVLYLPLNWYHGGMTSVQWLRAIALDGTMYHLWYFPAVLLGVWIARGLLRLGNIPAFCIAVGLYLIGLGGDSYYGLVCQIGPMRSFYDGVFQVWTYTRNGLFFTPLFFLLGALPVQMRQRTAAVGAVAAMVCMSLEAFWLHQTGSVRHDSMYLSLPVCMVFLFTLLRGANAAQDRRARGISMLVYLLHPWCIVLVRGAAKVLGLQVWLVQNSVVYFLAVLSLSFAAATIAWGLRPLPRETQARAWRELDLDALRHNAAQLQDALAPECQLIAVVKADAYGHGAAAVCRCLQKQGMRAYAVASLAEGIALRKKGLRGEILILGDTPPRQAPLLARWRLTQTLSGLPQAVALSQQGLRLRTHLALDTGMHRLGVFAQDLEAIEQIYRLPNLRIQGVFSHLCVCDSLKERDIAFTQWQLQQFYQAVNQIRKMGFDPGHIHIQASYGIWNLPAQPCSYARAGMALYGVQSQPGPVQYPLQLQPVLALRARISVVQILQAGQRAGYGLEFCAERPTRLAVVGIGYADGLPRQLPQCGGQVLIRGQRCPMVGKMCMDQLLVDVTQLQEASPGDVVTLLGCDGTQMIRAEEVAVSCGTIANEVLSRLNPLLPVVCREKMRQRSLKHKQHSASCARQNQQV